MNPEKPKQVQDTSAEEKLFNAVLEVAGDDEKMIRKGVIEALRGINDEARRKYLWNELSRKATERIRRARQKFAA